ncbi:hypothetical protein D3C80_2150610 [compost metagenome]
MLQIGGLVDKAWNVAGPDTERWLASAVGGFHHSGASGCKYECDIGMVHEQLRRFDGRLFDPADTAFWCTSLQCGFV